MLTMRTMRWLWVALLVVAGGAAVAYQAGGYQSQVAGGSLQIGFADSRYVNATGDQMTGPLSVDGGLSAQTLTVNGLEYVRGALSVDGGFSAQSAAINGVETVSGKLTVDGGIAVNNAATFTGPMTATSVAAAGQIKTGLNPAGTAADQASVTVNPGACGANEYLIAASVDGGVKFGADCEGDVTIAVGRTITWVGAGSITGEAGGSLVIPYLRVSSGLYGGSSAGQPLTINASNVVPAAATYDIGASNQSWRSIYLNSLAFIGVTAQVVTVADDTVGSQAAAVTITPTSSEIKATCNDPDGCAITWSETGASDGERVTLTNIGTNAFTSADSAGVYQGSAPTIGAGDVLTVHYINSQWYQQAFSDN